MALYMLMIYYWNFIDKFTNLIKGINKITWKVENQKF